MENIALLDKILLSILLVAIFSRILKHSMILYFNKKWNRAQLIEDIPCIYKEKNKDDHKKFICTNYFFNKKNWKNGICKQNECRGYKGTNKEFDDLLETNTVIIVLFDFLDILGSLSSFILIFRTLLMKE